MHRCKVQIELSSEYLVEFRSKCTGAMCTKTVQMHLAIKTQRGEPSSVCFAEGSFCGGSADRAQKIGGLQNHSLYTGFIMRGFIIVSRICMCDEKVLHGTMR